MRLRTSYSLFALALGVASCGAPSASITPILASMAVDGDISISDGTGTANVQSTFDDLGLDDNEAAVGGILRLNMGGAEFSISALGVDFMGEGAATGTFQFQGNTITAGAPVATELGIQMARGMVTWDVIPLGALDIGIGFGATLVDFDLKMKELNTQATLETSQLLPIPLLAARVKWTWGPVDLHADIGGLAIKYDGNEASMYDAGINASVDFLGIGDLVVGYKTMRIDAKYNDASARIDTNFNLDGYYFGLRFSF